MLAWSVAVVSLLGGLPLGPLVGQQTGSDTVTAYDAGAPPQARNRLTPWLTVGAKLELDYEFRRHWDLTNRGGDDRSTLAPEPSLAVAVTPNAGTRAFLSLELSRRFALGRPDNGDRDLAIELRQAYLQLKSRGDGRYSVRLGRQRFKDRREWIHDAELDGLRFRYDTGPLDIELALTPGTNTFSLETDLRLTSDVRVGTFMLLGGRRPSEGGRLLLGVRSDGDLAPNLEYWAQVARLAGRDGATVVRATGIDVGVTYQPDVLLRPALTLAYAYGSGDADPGDRIETQFRQTGLQGNQERMAGVTNLKYYGELLDPELSNLTIATVGLGLRPSRRSSVELILHGYRQPIVSAELHGANVSADPSGRHRDIGSEIDLILGYREIRDVTLKLVLGWFHPGRAFEDPAESSAFGEFTIDFRI
ncbi:MAG: alginate export family protein [Gemmatimonadales bacterium]|nr:alginate export family protein [Gemmatimonadales bacterium]